MKCWQTAKPESIQFLIREAATFLPQIGRLKPEDVIAPEPLRSVRGVYVRIRAGTARRVVGERRLAK